MTWFTTVGGKVIAPDGQPWMAGGCAIWDATRADQLLSLYPKTTFIRLPCGKFETSDFWGAFIDKMGARKIVCEIEYHPWPLINAPAGADLDKLVAWYTQWAEFGLTRPYLWFGDMNEPQGGDISSEHAAVYQAIRGTGNQTPIILECGVGAGNPGNVGAAVLRPSVYASMHAILWGQHVYPWIERTSDQDTFNAAMMGSVASNSGFAAAQAILGGDGPVPVINEEFGPSTDGMNLDQTYQTCLTAVTQWAPSQGHTVGWCGWIFDPGSGPDELLTPDGTQLTSWGQELAGFIAALPALPQGKTVTTPPSNQNAQPGNYQTFNYNGMPWFLLPPDNYDPAYQYPCILFLHQYENEGDEPQQTGPWFNTAAFRAAHPCFVIVPRCQINSQTSTPTFNWGGVDPNLQQPIVNALAILASVEAGYSIDSNRLYLTGNSMGGLGTWGVLCNATQWPQFAAAMPVSGSCYYNVGNETNIAMSLKNLPIWSCHGGQDTQVSPQFDQTIMPMLLKLNPVDKFTNDPNGQHDTWDAFYADPATWNWLFAQSKGVTVTSTKPASANNTVITPGVGSIVDAGGNTWAIGTNGVMLVNGAPDVSTSGVISAAYVGGLVWQENTGKLWWGKASPSATWSPPAGTPQSPLPVPPVVVPPVVVPPAPTVTHLTLATKIAQAGTLLAQVNALLTEVVQGLVSLTP